MAYHGYRVRLISGRSGSITGHIGLIIRGSLRPSNGTVNRGSLYPVSMQEQGKCPIQVRNRSSL
jgi:hypothetical protein